MDNINLTNIDYFIIVFSLFSWLLFIFLWLEKLHKFYFGIILGFILFIVMNLHLKLLIQPNIVLNNVVIQDSWFLLNNKTFILSFLATLIPIFWFLILFSDFISFKVYENKLASFIFWIFFPFFIISIFSYIFINSATTIAFLKDFFTVFDTSNIINYFKDRSYLALYLLFFLIFFRLIFWILVSFIIYIFKQFYSSYKSEQSVNHGEHHEEAEENHHH